MARRYFLTSPTNIQLGLLLLAATATATFSPPASAELSEHYLDYTCPQLPQGARCIFISATDGDDVNNDGTKEAPLQSFRRITDDPTGVVNAGTRIELPPGSIILLDQGNYDVSRKRFRGPAFPSPSSCYNSELQGHPKKYFRGLYLSRKSDLTIKAIPGTTPRITNSNKNSGGIYVSRSDNITIEGLTFVRMYGRAIHFSIVNDAAIRDVRVLKTRFCQNDTGSAIRVHGSRRVSIRNTEFLDSYDRFWEEGSRGDAGKPLGSNHLILADSSDTTIEHSVFRFSVRSKRTMAPCLAIGRSNDSSRPTATIRFNEFYNCQEYDIKIGAPRVEIRGNLFDHHGRISMAPVLGCPSDRVTAFIDRIVLADNTFANPKRRTIDIGGSTCLEAGSDVSLINNRFALDNPAVEDSERPTEILSLFKYHGTGQPMAELDRRLRSWAINDNCITGPSKPSYGFLYGAHPAAEDAAYTDADVEQYRWGLVDTDSVNEIYGDNSFFEVASPNAPRCATAGRAAHAPVPGERYYPSGRDRIFADRFTMTWGAFAKAEDYRVYVYRNSRLLWRSQVLSSGDVGCATGGTCSLELSPESARKKFLINGNKSLRYYVRGRNGIDKSFSPPQEFLIVTDSPRAPRLLEPSTTVTSRDPVFSWENDRETERYFIEIDELDDLDRIIRTTAVYLPSAALVGDTWITNFSELARDNMNGLATNATKIRYLLVAENYVGPGRARNFTTATVDISQ